jgi:hypothetical protein
MKNLNNVSLEIELPLEGFEWKTFSYFETFKHQIHVTFNWLFCSLLDQHDWLIQINDQTYFTIDTVEKFQRHCANKLRCSCCNKIVDVDDAKLTFSEDVWYNHFTKKYFHYHY